MARYGDLFSGYRPGGSWAINYSQRDPWGSNALYGAGAGGAAGATGATGVSGGTGTTPVATAGNLQGAPGTGGSGTPYGRVPQVPTPSASQGAAIRANVTNAPALYNLATQTNQFNQGALLDAYRSAFPDYNRNLSQASANVLSNLQGVLSPDVLRNMQQASAERGIATGLTGAPNIGAAYLRTLGLTSLDLQNRGQEQFNALRAGTPIARPWDPSQFYISPGQQQAAQAAANVGAAAPDPAQAAAAAQAAARAGLGVGAGIGGGGGGVNRGISIPTFPTMGSGVNPFVGTSTGTGVSYGGVIRNEAPSQAPTYDPVIGGYVHPDGSISDTPTSQPWSGFSQSGVNTPAVYDPYYFSEGTNLMDPSLYGYEGAG